MLREDRRSVLADAVLPDQQGSQAVLVSFVFICNPFVCYCPGCPNSNVATHKVSYLYGSAATSRDFMLMHLTNLSFLASFGHLA